MYLNTIKTQKKLHTFVIKNKQQQQQQIYGAPIQLLMVNFKGQQAH